MINRKLIIGTTALLGLTLPTSAFAGQAQVYGDRIQVQSSKSMSNLTLTVSGPDGFYATGFSKSGTPTATFAAASGLADGVYKWQLSGATSQMVRANSNGLDNGRGAAERSYVNKSDSESGMFRVKNGSVFAPGNQAEERSAKSEK
jgi:hypothetical protein